MEAARRQRSNYEEFETARGRPDATLAGDDLEKILRLPSAGREARPDGAPERTSAPSARCTTRSSR